AGYRNGDTTVLLHYGILLGEDAPDPAAQADDVAGLLRTIDGRLDWGCVTVLASSARPLQRVVLLARVLPVLELDDAHLGELGAQPALTRVQQPQLLAVGDDLGEQHLLEHPPPLVLEHQRQDFGGLDPHALPDLLLEEPVTHPDGGLEGELLALAQLGVAELGGAPLERPHAPGP